MLILVLAVKLKLLPVSGWYGLEYAVLPILSMSLYAIAMQMRMTRSCMLECQRQDYVTTARAKGQSERKITYHHVLRNALIPIVTSSGQHFGIYARRSSLVQNRFHNSCIGNSDGYRKLTPVIPTDSEEAYFACRHIQYCESVGRYSVCLSGSKN